MEQTKQGYSNNFYLKAAGKLIENTPMAVFRVRMAYFKNKMAEPAFEQGANLLMNNLQLVVENKSQKFDKEAQFRALQSMITFLPALKEETTYDRDHKYASLREIQNLCRNNASDTTSALGSLARGTLAKDTYALAG